MRRRPRSAYRRLSILVLDDGLLDGHLTEHPTVDTAADDPAQLYYTSGTTGLAKGIELRRRLLELLLEPSS